MTNQNDRSGAVPEWLVERLAAGDLSAAQAESLRTRLVDEPGGAERLQRIATSNAEILAAHPPDTMAALIRARAARVKTAPMRGPRFWLLTVATPMVAFAAVAVLFFSPARLGLGPGTFRGDGSGAAASDDGERIKGLQPGLRVYRQIGDKAERLAPGAKTHAGDRLQLAYVAGGHRFGAVLSVDGNGHVTFHLPTAAGAASRLRLDGEVALTDSYELDAAPGFERFIFVSGDAPFDTAVLADVIRGSASAPAGTVLISFTVRKE